MPKIFPNNEHLVDKGKLSEMQEKSTTIQSCTVGIESASRTAAKDPPCFHSDHCMPRKRERGTRGHCHLHVSLNTHVVTKNNMELNML